VSDAPTCLRCGGSINPFTCRVVPGHGVICVPCCEKEEAMTASKPPDEGTPRDINDNSTPRTDDLAYKLWGKWSVPGEIEAFDLCRQLERELQAERQRCEELRKLVIERDKLNVNYAAQVTAAESRAASAEKDAARYWWIRSFVYPLQLIVGPDEHEIVTTNGGEFFRSRLDAMIDARIAACPPPKSTKEITAIDAASGEAG